MTQVRLQSCSDARGELAMGLLAQRPGTGVLRRPIVGLLQSLFRPRTLAPEQPLSVTPSRPGWRALATISRATSAGNFLRCGHFLIPASVTGGPSSAANWRYVSEIRSRG